MHAHDQELRVKQLPQSRGEVIATAPIITGVIRLSLYKDETNMVWSDVVKSPMRLIMQQYPNLSRARPPATPALRTWAACWEGPPGRSRRLLGTCGFTHGPQSTRSSATPIRGSSKPAEGVFTSISARHIPAFCKAQLSGCAGRRAQNEIRGLEGLQGH